MILGIPQFPGAGSWCVVLSLFSGCICIVLRRHYNDGVCFDYLDLCDFHLIIFLRFSLSFCIPCQTICYCLFVLIVVWRFSNLIMKPDDEKLH